MPVGNSPTSALALALALALARLLKDCANTFNVNWDSGSLSATSSNALEVFKDNFNYSYNASCQNYYLTKFKSEILSGRPVYLRDCVTRTTIQTMHRVGDGVQVIDLIIKRLTALTLPKPITISFKNVTRFADGNGLLIPSADNPVEFWQLQKSILGQDQLTKEQNPHITLMHLRNATCTDAIFVEIKRMEFPAEISFGKISLIEQRNGSKWNVL